MIIYVTERDIKHGMRRSATCCPVQRAIHRRMRIPLIVERGGVQYDDGFATRLPIKAQERIRLYDNGGLMKPFRFTLAETAYRTAIV